MTPRGAFVLLVLLAAAAALAIGTKCTREPDAAPHAAREETADAAADAAPALATAPGSDAAAAGRRVEHARDDRAAAAGTAATAGLRVLVAFDDGAPAPDRGVLVEEPRAGRPVRVHRATTDRAGVAAFAALPAVRHVVRTIGAPAQEVRLDAGGTATVTIALARGIGIEGRVVDADGAPVAGATIWSMPPGGNLQHEDAAPVARSRDDGGFRIDGPALPIRQWIAARAADHVASPWRLVVATDQPAAARDVVLRLRTGGAGVVGSCTRVDGTPVPHATVRLAPLGAARERDGTAQLWPGHLHETAADGDGRFAFAAIAAGPWSVSAQRDGLWFEPREVELARGGTSTVQLVGEPSADLAGVVVDEAGAPVAKAFVRDRADRAARDDTDERGAFAIHDLPPRRRELLVFADDCEDAVHAVDLRAGANDARLVVQRSARLTGVARTPRGEPLRGWHVGALAGPRAGDPLQVVADVATDDEGAFALPLPDRTPRLLCVTSPASPFMVVLEELGPVAPGGVPIVLVVPDRVVPSAALTGRLPPPEDTRRYTLAVLGASSQRVASFGDCTIDAATGTFRVGPLPAGSWSLLCSIRDQPANGSATPTPGVLHFGPWSLANGQALDVGTLPVPQPGRLEVTLTPGSDCAPADVKLQWNDAGSATWGLLPIDASLAGSWAMLPGDYDVTIWGERFVSVERRVTVPPPPAGAARIDAVLQAGQRLPLELRLPDGETRATFVVRDPAGRVAYEDEFGIDEARVVTRTPVLGRGPHVVEVTGGSGRRFAGDFVVQSLTPTRQPIRFALRPGR